MSDHGRFVWHELLTNDADAAIAFYSAVVGWTPEDMDGPHGRYTVMKVGDRGVGGIMQVSPETVDGGARPAWFGYIAVDDVDAWSRKAEAAGGKVHMGPMDIPGIGRFSMVTDPQGAMVVLFKPLPMQAPPPVPMDTPGAVCWNELHADDWEKAFGFYADLFGWTRAEAFPMGPQGTYQLFAAAAEAGGETLGGMYNREAGAPHAFWLFYITVEHIDRGLERVKRHGGEVLGEPMEVPGGAYVVECRDPQGAHFAISGYRKEQQA